MCYEGEGNTHAISNNFISTIQTKNHASIRPDFKGKVTLSAIRLHITLTVLT